MSRHVFSSMPVPQSGPASDRRVERIAVGQWEGLKVCAQWDVIDGRGEPHRVVIFTEPRRPVTAEAVRRLPLGTILGGMRRDLAWEAGFPGIQSDARQPVYEAATVGPRRGRPLLADDLRDVAGVYRAAWFDGRPVTAAVADRFGIAQSTAAKRIRAARKAGLLEGVGVKR